MIRPQFQRQGFTLLEIMLATLVFALVVIGYAMCLNRTLDAAIQNERETYVRLHLEALLAEAHQLQLQPGKETLETDERGITYEKEVELLVLKNEKKQDLAGLYNVVFRARWKEGGEETTQQVNLYRYQP